MTDLTKAKEELRNNEKLLQIERNDKSDPTKQALIRQHDDNNTLQEDLINNEIDAICNKTLETYIEPLTKQNLNFSVEYQGRRAVFDLVHENQTFGEIKPTIAQYFALPTEVIFFKNDKEEVLLSNLKVKTTLFPMLNCKFRGQTPILKLALRSNQTTIDYIMGDEGAKAALIQEQDDQDKMHQKTIKQSRMRDENKRKEISQRKLAEQKKKRNKCIQVVIGMIQTTIFILFTIFQIQLIVSQRNVISAYYTNQATKYKLFAFDNDYVEFAGFNQTFDYIENVLGTQTVANRTHFETFWTNNYLLWYIRVQQIRGIKQSCAWSGRDGLGDIFENQTCISTFASKMYETGEFQNQTYQEDTTLLQDRDTFYTYGNNGYFKYLNVANGNWTKALSTEVTGTNWIDNQTLAIIMTLNTFNPNTNLFQVFKLIFNFQPSDIVRLETSVQIIKLKLYSTGDESTLCALIYIIGTILLIISIISIIREKRRKIEEDRERQKENEKKGVEEEKDQNEENDKHLQINEEEESEEEEIQNQNKFKRCLQKFKRKLRCCKRLYSKMKCCRGALKGISTFEIINFIMIICSFINLGLKYGYDDWLDRAVNQNQAVTEFIDLSEVYIFYEAISMFDSIIVFMMAVSIVKYCFFWIPSLSMITISMKAYLNSTVKKVVYFVILLSLIFTAFCYFFYSQFAYGFSDYSFALIRAVLLFVQGNLFNNNVVFLVDETAEYLFKRQGWVATIISIGTMHIFGRYVILNIIVAFMKKDLSDTKKRLKEQKLIKKRRAEDKIQEKLKGNNKK